MISDNPKSHKIAYNLKTLIGPHNINANYFKGL